MRLRAPSGARCWFAGLLRRKSRFYSILFYSRYDAEYIRHYAGVAVEYVPSYCGYATSQASYRPEAGRPVLFARNHNNPSALYAQLHKAAAREGRKRGRSGRRAGGLGGGGALLQVGTLRFV